MKQQIKNSIILCTLLFAFAGCTFAKEDVIVGGNEESVSDINPVQVEPLTIDQWQTYAKMADESIKTDPVFIPVEDDLEPQLQGKIDAYDFSGSELEADAEEIKSKFNNL